MGRAPPTNAYRALFNDGRAEDLSRSELPFTDMHGQEVALGHAGKGSQQRAEMHLSPDRIKRRPRANTRDDLHGRAEATSMVDEAVFGKTPVGGALRQVNLAANFLMNTEGDFDKGRR